MTNKEIWRYDAGYLLMGRVFFVSGLIMAALSGIGWILKVLNVW